MRKRRIHPELILDAINEYLNGKISQNAIAKKLGVAPNAVSQWIANYESMGKEAFICNGNKHYSKGFKEQAVAEYLY